ncbi:uncharacterized protein LOC143287495 [Babylonia areolata]|uniref:uncharacterized protein LOC143287495 n=1 Tax=Babylonia areolata TaxID=304850 RepID=UPI003FCF1692
MGLTSSTVQIDLPSSQEAEFVKQTVETNPVVMFSKTTCTYCNVAKNIFGELGVPVKVYELDRMNEGTALQNVLGEITEARTVPRVFINGQCIGGCSELKSLHQSGKLKQML